MDNYDIDREYIKTWRKLSLVAIYGSLDNQHQVLYSNYKQSNHIFKQLGAIRENYKMIKELLDETK